MAFGGQFRWYLSVEISKEYEAVFRRKRLGIASDAIDEFLRDLRRTTLMVRPHRKLQVCADDADNKFLECALEARADFVVTGNARHFPSRFQDIRVILPAQFLALLAADPR